jgi:hypothetical protein
MKTGAVTLGFIGLLNVKTIGAVGEATGPKLRGTIERIRG